MSASESVCLYPCTRVSAARKINCDFTNINGTKQRVEAVTLQDGEFVENQGKNMDTIAEAGV